MTPEHSADQFADERSQMIEDHLIPRGITDQQVLAAMAEVPREEFVSPAHIERTYDDGALPIDCNQTISQPFTVAFMCESAELKPTDKVLEIGTGSGYGAAVLSRLAAEVHTVECIPKLATSARDRLRRLKYDNVTVHLADGSLGLPTEAPFDAILVTAAAPVLPQPYVEQLADSGRIVIPLGRGSNQSMFVFRKRGRELDSTKLGAFQFVPLVGQHGASPIRSSDV